MAKLNEIIVALKQKRDDVANRDVATIVEEKVNAYRARALEEAEAEKKAELAVCEIRLETAEQILAEMSVPEVETI